MFNSITFFIILLLARLYTRVGILLTCGKTLAWQHHFAKWGGLAPHNYFNSATIKNGQSRETGHIGYTSYAQAHTINVNKTWSLLQTIGGNDEPNIVIMQKSLRTSQHGTKNLKAHNRITEKLKHEQVSTFSDISSKFCLMMMMMYG